MMKLVVDNISEWRQSVNTVMGDEFYDILFHSIVLGGGRHFSFIYSFTMRPSLGQGLIKHCNMSVLLSVPRAYDLLQIGKP